MDAIVKTIDQVNESLSIHRSLFVCETCEESNQVFDILCLHEYPCVRSTEPHECDKNKHRVVVGTLEEITDNVTSFEEITVIYTVNMDDIAELTRLCSTFGIMLVVICVHS